MFPYLLRQITFTKANSANEKNMKLAQPKNHISLALMYETLGKLLLNPPLSVMKVSIVEVPGRKYIS